MAVKSNRFVPVLVIVAVAIIATIFYMNRGATAVSEPMKSVPLPKTAGADEDTPAETLATVVASNRELRQDVQRVIRENDELRRQLKSGNPGSGAGTSLTPADPTAAPAVDQAAPGRPGRTGSTTPIDVLNNAWGNAVGTLGALGGQQQPGAPGAVAADGDPALDSAAGAVGYKVVPPMGYVAQTSTQQGMVTTRYVRSPASATDRKSVV